MVKPKGTGFGRCLSWLTIALIAFTSIGICYEVHKCTDTLLYAIFESKFKEPVEVVYILMNDLVLYKMTSNDTGKISDFAYLYHLGNRLQKDSYNVSDILVIIHGHERSRYFSPTDIRTWRNFKRAGFTGRFCIYLKRNRTIYEIIEDNDNDS